MKRTRAASGADQGTGADRLKSSTRRLARLLRAQVPPPSLDAAQPLTEWDQRTDERLQALEQQLANQNRLLLLTFVSIAADLIAKVAVTR
jgi:hypothetical protein